jgi:CRISPR-associated protein Cmr3
MMTAAIMSTTERRIALHLEPLDVLFFRDGRPFTPASRGVSGLPSPQTLAGAVRTQLLREVGCDFQKLGAAMRNGSCFAEACEVACQAGWIGRARVRGPWFAKRPHSSGGEPQVYVPTPASLHKPKGSKDVIPDDKELLRLDPLSPSRHLPGWRPPADGMRPLWPGQYVRSERTGGYLTPDGLAEFLLGNVPPYKEVLDLDTFADFDHRTGIGVEPDRLTAEESILYSASFLVLKPEVMLYAEVDLPGGAPSDALAAARSIPLGGEGRQVRVHAGAKFDWHRVQPSAAPGRTAALLTTPGIFKERWRPACLGNDVGLIAAAVPGHEAVSGWDLARGGPKPNRFAVPAGTVYFLETPTQTLELPSLADDDEDRRQGWGCFLKGVWNYV